MHLSLDRAVVLEQAITACLLSPAALDRREQVDLQPGEVHVWLIDPTTPVHAEQWLAFERILDTHERRQLRALVFQRHRAQYLFAHALLRRTLSRYVTRDPAAWQFTRGPHGRPEIDGTSPKPLRFSLSHTDGLVGLAVALASDIGFDLERTSRPVEALALARGYFAPEEVRALQSVSPTEQQERFFEFWTLKEAYVKARGFGLSLPLDRFFFEVTAGAAPRLVVSDDLDNDARAWRFSLTRPTSEHCMAIGFRGVVA